MVDTAGPPPKPRRSAKQPHPYAPDAAARALARLRDEFAMAALTGIISRVGWYEDAARWAYKAADAMLEARGK